MHHERYIPRYCQNPEEYELINGNCYESESLLNSNITYIELQTVNKDDTTININTNNIENKSDETKLFTGRSKRKTDKFKRVNKINKTLKNQKLIDLPKFEITFKEKFDIKVNDDIAEAILIGQYGVRMHKKPSSMAFGVR